MAKAGLASLAFLAWALAPAFELAQPATAAGPEAVTVATGAFFALSVGDIQTSARWYSEKLGMTVVMEQPRQAGAAVVVLEGGGLIVELVEQDGAVPLKEVTPKAENPMLVHGIVKAGALLENYDDAVAAFKKRGVEMAFGPYPGTESQRPNVIIRDNGGNLIQFFGGTPGSPTRR
jgi:catechol 2,3-dioxygenase-like lactoylglutathione lyase family enzyme